MNEQDYAIVVGIRRYPTFKPPVPGQPYDLDGPDTDATEIYDWLTSPTAGGVPEDQALLIRSLDFPDHVPSNSAPEPNEQTIEGAFGWLLCASATMEKPVHRTTVLSLFQRAWFQQNTKGRRYLYGRRRPDDAQPFLGHGVVRQALRGRAI